jgi:hypothetical protein
VDTGCVAVVARWVRVSGCLPHEPGEIHGEPFETHIEGDLATSIGVSLAEALASSPDFEHVKLLGCTGSLFSPPSHAPVTRAGRNMNASSHEALPEDTVMHRKFF